MPYRLPWLSLQAPNWTTLPSGQHPRAPPPLGHTHWACGCRSVCVLGCPLTKPHHWQSGASLAIRFLCPLQGFPSVWPQSPIEAPLLSSLSCAQKAEKRRQITICEKVIYINLNGIYSNVLRGLSLKQLVPPLTVSEFKNMPRKR